MLNQFVILLCFSVTFYNNNNSILIYADNISPFLRGLLILVLLWNFFVRFQAFESSLRDVSTLLEAWDRTSGSVFLPESEKFDMEPDPVPITVNKKGLSSHRKFEKEKEKEKEKLKEVTNIWNLYW